MNKVLRSFKPLAFAFCNPLWPRAAPGAAPQSAFAWFALLDNH
jgi:hypothetical protein